MDSSIPIGAGYRIGIDGLIDFVPGIGDVAGVLVSMYIVYLAAASGAPQPVLMRMAGNVPMRASAPEYRDSCYRTGSAALAVVPANTGARR